MAQGREWWRPSDRAGAIASGGSLARAEHQSGSFAQPWEGRFDARRCCLSRAGIVPGRVSAARQPRRSRRAASPVPAQKGSACARLPRNEAASREPGQRRIGPRRSVRAESSMWKCQYAKARLRVKIPTAPGLGRRSGWIIQAFPAGAVPGRRCGERSAPRAARRQRRARFLAAAPIAAFAP